MRLQWTDLDDPAGHQRYLAQHAGSLVPWPAIGVLLAGLLTLTMLWLWWS